MPQQREPDRRWEVPRLGLPPFVGDEFEPLSTFRPNGNYRCAGKGTQCTYDEGTPAYYQIADQCKAKLKTITHQLLTKRVKAIMGEKGECEITSMDG